MDKLGGLRRIAGAGSNHSGVRRSLLAVAMLAALAVVLTPVGSAGTTNKPFAAVFGSTVTPAVSTPVNGTAGDGGVTLTITDEARNQALGSANVYAPPGVTITGTDAPASNLDPTQTFPTSTLMLRNLNLPTNGNPSLETTIYLSAPGCASFTWGIDAHQSNDYNSSSGNSLYLDSAKSSLDTLDPSGCHLAWVYQPASANQSTTITDTPFTASGNDVAVAVENANGQPVALDTGTATLNVSGSFDPCATTCTPTFGGLTSTTFQNGVATFPSFQSAYTGTGFTATASAVGLSTAPSSPSFVIEQNGTDCVGLNPCQLNTTLGNSPLSISGNGGNFLYIAVSSTQIPSTVTGPGGGCANFVGTGTSFAETDARSGDGTVDITVSIPNTALKKAYGPNYGQPNVPICAGAKRLDANDNPINCQDDPLGGFADRTLASNGTFSGSYGTAVCDPTSGYWWGVLGTYQDPVSLGFDSNSIPLITGWGSTIGNGYRTFTIHEPDGWDGHFGA